MRGGGLERGANHISPSRPPLPQDTPEVPIKEEIGIDDIITGAA